MNAFDVQTSRVWPGGLHSEKIETLQVNLGRFCNLACRHCHLECSPDRTEMMARETLLQILEVIRSSAYRLVDVTGGAPELHAHFRTFIEAVRETGHTVRVRTNLVSLLKPELEGMETFRRMPG